MYRRTVSFGFVKPHDLPGVRAALPGDLDLESPASVSQTPMMSSTADRASALSAPSAPQAAAHTI